MDSKKLDQLREKLSAEQYNICFLKGTEPPGSGKYDKFYEPGSYHCAVCDQKLFDSNTKFDSGTGWPSFWDMADPKVISLEDDDSLGLRRTEVRCANCGSHLGHVFPDGPKTLPDGGQATGQRYCINSLALEFVPTKV